jgi:hypothetical protein
MKKIGFDRNRRLFVGAVAITGTLYAAAIGRGALKACGVDEVHFVDLQPLIRIGDAYLDEIATSGELRALHNELLADHLMPSADLADAIQRRFLAVRDQAQEEFQRGETVSCDGWILARSEARLCAVAAVSIRRSQGIPGFI